MAKKIIEITVETERLLVIHRRRRALQAWCVRCVSEVALVTPLEAAFLAGVSLSDVRRLMQTGLLHSCVTAAGAEAICFQSLCEYAGL